METLVIEGTKKTPTVNFDKTSGKLELKGRSIPENAIEFYKPLVDWIEAYSVAPQSNTTVNVQLEYFNSSSSKCIIDILRRIEKIMNPGNNVIINWCCEDDDEDMLNAGYDFKATLKVPFRIHEMTS